MSSPSVLPERIFETPIADSKGLVKEQAWRRVFQVLAKPARIPQLLPLNHATRLRTQASSYAEGSQFYESDRTVYYIVRQGVWVYDRGTYSAPQTFLPTDLGPNDVGFLFYVSDYAHLLRWTGTTWIWAPGDLGSDYSVAFVTGPDDPTGWQACDGSTVQRLVSNGSLVAATVPNTPGSFYRQ